MKLIYRVIKKTPIAFKDRNFSRSELKIWSQYKMSQNRDRKTVKSRLFRFLNFEYVCWIQIWNRISDMLIASAQKLQLFIASAQKMKKFNSSCIMTGTHVLIDMTKIRSNLSTLNPTLKLFLSYQYTRYPESCLFKCLMNSQSGLKWKIADSFLN